MRMTRYFFISNNLDDLERFETDLEDTGVVKPQIHVLTDYEDDAYRHHLHQVTPFMKSDVVHSAVIGAAVGVCLAVVALLAALVAGLSEITVGYWPFIFLAVVVIGFCTWVGGLRGIQASNSRTRRFDQAVKDGKHVFFVDQPHGEGAALAQLAGRYTSVDMAGRARGAPSWIVFSQHKVKHFFKHTFP